MRAIPFRRSGITLLAFLASASLAEAADPQPAPEVTLDPITVSATRRAERAFDVPASVDVIDGATIHDGQPQVNLSETLVRVPGIFAANRQNYAQDLQISSRGFGARATFGVRGVRLYQDMIPVTMPDGQGQTGSFSLLSAARIEVLRGPYSTLYGNASGGVISVFTEDPPQKPAVNATAGGGSYGTLTLGGKGGSSTEHAGALAAASYFTTDGYRDHSSARRDIGNAKLVLDATPDTRLTVIGNLQYQPETQDPLGLARAQWQSNPRQADPAATQFDTRKTINQMQGGAALRQRLGDDVELIVTGYGGRRAIRQYLALSGLLPATSSGGVTDLDRDFGGVGARVVWKARVLERPLTLSLGGDFDRQHELRRGFVNNSGSLGALRRDEDDVVIGSDAYAQAEWDVASWLTLTAGVRGSEVRYSSEDHFITAQNPDDSGAIHFHDTSPVLGAVWHVRDDVNAYASYGQGFETPTLAELAYRSDGGTGLNFALKPATSRSVEAGVKTVIAKNHRINVALFHIDTDDEIVIDTATGGRTTYKNASTTRRRGVEAEWTGQLPYGLATQVALTWLRAEFTQSFTSGSPPQTVAAGSKLPGVPSQQAYGELAWTPGGYGGFNAAVEAQYVAKLYVNDRNSDAAPAYSIANVRAGLVQSWQRATFREFVRVNNLFDRNYVGSVIVGDTNGRFFEPAPGRNWFVGASVDVPL
jgi:iron complex outermembrane receptor protein